MSHHDYRYSNQHSEYKSRGHQSSHTGGYHGGGYRGGYNSYHNNHYQGGYNNSYDGYNSNYYNKRGGGGGYHSHSPPAPRHHQRGGGGSGGYRGDNKQGPGQHKTQQQSQTQSQGQQAQQQQQQQQQAQTIQSQSQTPTQTLDINEEEQQKQYQLQQQQFLLQHPQAAFMSEEERQQLQQAYASYLFDPDDYDDSDHQYPPLPPSNNFYSDEPAPITTEDLFAQCNWKPLPSHQDDGNDEEETIESAVFNDIPQRLEDIYLLSNKNRSLKKKKQEKGTSGLPKIHVTDDEDSVYTDVIASLKPKNPIEDYESTLSFVVTLGWLQPQSGDSIPPRPPRQQPPKKKKMGGPGYGPGSGYY